MSLGARLETEINMKDRDCCFGNTRTSLRFLMTAFKGLSSSGVFRLPGVGATIEVSTIVMALIIRPCGNAIWTESEEADASGSRRPCLPLPGYGGREVSTLSGGDRISGHVSVNKTRCGPAVAFRVASFGVGGWSIEISIQEE